MISEKKFWPLFWTQFLGATNDNVLKNAMVIMVEYKGLSMAGLDAPSIVALSGAIFILPFFLFSMLAGQIADKYEKSRLVRIVKFWELSITLVSTFGFYFHWVELLLLALFMMGVHSTFFGPIKYSAIPELVSPLNLVSANAYVEAGTVQAILLGTIGGGVVIAMDHGELWASLVVNIIALMGLFSCWRLVRMPPRAPALKVVFSPVAPVVDVIRLLRGQPELFVAIMAISWFWFFGAAALSVLPALCKEFLRVNEHVLTTFLAMYTMGVGLGSLACSRLSRRKVELGMVPIGALGVSLFLFDLYRVPVSGISSGDLLNLREFLGTAHGWRLFFDYFFTSFSAGFFLVPLYTLLQERCEKSYLSRVIAGNNVFNAIFMVVSAVLVMVMHMRGFTPVETMLGLGVGNILFCGFLFWRAPVFFVELKRWVVR